jgi:hypothetical protein
VIERVAVPTFGEICQHIVNQAINRTEEVGCEASEDAVRLNEDGDGGEPEGNQQKENQAYVITISLASLETVAVLFPFLRHVRDAVLIDAERTDDGTVDSAEKQCYHNDCDDDNETRSEHGRHKLKLRHPAEISMKRSGEIKKKQRYKYQTYSR